MSTGLRVAPNLTLPLEAVTQTIAILGNRGSGKTNTAGVIVEEAQRQGQQTVIIDPLDVWWGLRSSADGSKSGLPITVIGGHHGDLPLNGTDGRVVADVVVEHAVSVILSLRHLSKTDQRRFVADFAERLYERKGEQSRNTPVLVVIDEADAFVPQKVFHGAERMVGAIDDLVRRGRASGIGVVLISQRAAVVNKDVLTQLELLIAHRHTSPQDRKALDAWVEAHDTEGRRAAFMAEIASLPVGTAYFWSPGWLDVFRRVKVRARRTFDSSATPKVGQVVGEPKTLAPVDLEALRAKMQTTIERAKADDPRALRATITALEAKLRAAATAASATPAPRIERVEVAVMSPELLERTEAAAELLVQAMSGAERLWGEVRGSLEHARSLSANRPMPARTATPARAVAQPLARPTPAAATRRAPPPTTTGELGRAERAILAVLAQYPEGCARGKLALLAGYRYSGGFRNSLSALRTAGLIVGGNNEVMRILSEGLRVVADDAQPVPTGRGLIDYWLGHPSLGRAERAILAEITSHPGREFEAPELAAATGYEYSGGFRNALATLRTAGLLVGRNTGAMRANPALFGGAL